MRRLLSEELRPGSTKANLLLTTGGKALWYDHVQSNCCDWYRLPYVAAKQRRYWFEGVSPCAMAACAMRNARLLSGSLTALTALQAKFRLSSLVSAPLLGRAYLIPMGLAYKLHLCYLWVPPVLFLSFTTRSLSSTWFSVGPISHISFLCRASCSPCVIYRFLSVVRVCARLIEITLQLLELVSTHLKKTYTWVGNAFSFGDTIRAFKLSFYWFGSKFGTAPPCQSSDY